MKILGIGGMLHDASITLINDDKIELAVAVERITRKKHCGLHDASTFIQVLKNLNIDLDDIDAFAWADYYLYHKSSKAAEIKNLLEERNLLVFKHHDCHAASSFYCSPFDESIVITLDGKGDDLSAAIYLADKQGLHQISKTGMEFSLGRMWNAMNTMVGMPGYYSSGKTMALSAFGNAKNPEMENILRIQDNGSLVFSYNNKPADFFFNKENIVQMFSEISGLQPLNSSNELSREYFDLVASLQKLTNTTVNNFAQWAIDKVGRKPICLAGGVALNTVANTHLLQTNHPLEIFIQPASSDEGLSLGAAILAHQEITKTKKHFSFTPLLGREYDDNEIKCHIMNSGLSWTKPQNISRTVAELLSQKKIVGWFQGREEFGPRALGNRSILADPRNIETKTFLNKEVKHRELFRPFGPSLLKNDLQLFFDFNSDSPYMLFSPKATSRGRQEIPAALHVDDTGRIQTVEKETNQRFYDLIREFRSQTGVGVLVNTSFNKKDEPIAGSPQDSLSCFKTSNLDYLAIGDFLVIKK